MDVRRASRLANWIILPVIGVVELAWWWWGDLPDHRLDLLAALVVSLFALSLVGCAHGFVVRDPHRWRWLVVFAAFSLITGAVGYYVLGRADVDRIHTFVLAGGFGGLFLFLALATRRPSPAKRASP